MRINTNVSALIGWRNLATNDSNLSKSLERLSSGLRVNRAADDAAGLAISEKMRSQIRGLNQAVKNVADGNSLIQSAEASLNETHASLQRMRELALQAANGTLGPADRAQIQIEVDQLVAEIARGATSAEFNGKTLLDGSLSASGIGDVSLQVGPDAVHNLDVSIGAMDPRTLGIARDVLVGEVDNGPSRIARGDALVAERIQINGEGLTRYQEYGLRFTDPPAEVRLVDSTGATIGNAVAYDPNRPYITVGDPDTKRSVTFQPFRPPHALPANNDTDWFVVETAPTVVGSVGSISAGLTAGNYKVSYDSSSKSLQLQDSTGQAIGNRVPVKAGQTVVLGDLEAARTVTVTVSSTLPAESVTDTIDLGTPVGKVLSDPPERSVLMRPPLMFAGQVGAGLGAGTYRIAYDAQTDMVQLQDSTGTAIGAAVAFTPNLVVTVGDGGTGETIDVALNDRPPLHSTYTEVTVGGTADFWAPRVSVAAGSIIDNGVGTALGSALGYGQYTVEYNALTNEAQLRDSQGNAIGGPAPVGAAGSWMTVGSAATGRTISFEVQTPAPAGNATQTINFPQPSDFIETIGAAALGGVYSVVYNATTSTVELRDWTNALVGAAQPAVPGGTVTVGAGPNTVTIRLKAELPAGVLTSSTQVFPTTYSFTGEASHQIITKHDGIQKVGAGLESGTYRVAYDQASNSVMLQDSDGRIIGQGAAFVANSTVTIGDPTGLKTVTVKLTGTPPYGDGYSTIQVTNNDGAALAATFHNKVKYSEAQAKAGVNVSSAEAAREAVAIIDAAIAMVTNQRSQLGASQNRLEHTTNNLQVVSENLVAAESRIRDADMAQEMSTMTKTQVLIQSATAMLAQANTKSQAVLQLLKQ